MNLQKIFNIVFCFVLFALFASAQEPVVKTQEPAAKTQELDRGAGTKLRVVGKNGEVKDVKLYSASYALVIGMSAYQFWQPLSGPKEDVEAVKYALEKHSFKVETATDLTGEQLESRIKKFIGDYGYQVDNRLVIYFAGHGETLRTSDGREFGYIVPIDAPKSQDNELEFKRRAVSMEKVAGYASEIQTRHAMFVFDSCFSGKLLSRSELIPSAISEYLSRNVRQFITSGAASQKVPDKSEFRRWFVRGLEGEADLTRDGFVTGTELSKYLIEKVSNNSNGAQTPQYGTSRDADLEGGDMVFFLGKTEAQSVAENKEEGDWQAVKNASNAQLFRDFLNVYPNGRYASEAKLAIARIESSANPTSNAVVGSSLRNSTLTLNTLSFNALVLAPNSTEATETAKNARSYEEDLGSGVKLRMIEIPAGKFKMGSNANFDEKPIREVSINQFFAGATEITQAQWRVVSKMAKVKISLPSDPASAVGDNLPVESITWEEAEEFCARLSRYTGREYSLPSEAEWEYAARANSTGSFAFGERIKPEYVNFKSDVNSPKSTTGVYRKQPVTVGSLGFANAFGLYDMHGNVAEWCLDNWHDNYEGAPTNGEAWFGQSSKRINRGGSFNLLAPRLCSSCRNSMEKDLSSPGVGLRVVMRQAQ